MALTRLVDTDDSGLGTDGTIHNNVWLQDLNDTIDSRWSEMTITLTGTQNNVSITTGGIEADVLVCNNASDLTITGISAPASPAKVGKPLTVMALGTGNVYLIHNSGSSSVGNRLSNCATSGMTPLSGPGRGVAVYRYNTSVLGAWVLVNHEQGAAITPIFSDSHYTGAGTDADWTLASGDRATQDYYLKGRRLFVSWYLDTTSVSNTPATLRITNGAWGGFTIAATKLRTCLYNDNGGGNTVGYIVATGTATDLRITKVAGGTFANATNATGTFGDIDFEVT
jgi:hypothetical protein